MLSLYGLDSAQYRQSQCSLHLDSKNVKQYPKPWKHLKNAKEARKNGCLGLRTILNCGNVWTGPCKTYIEIRVSQNLN